MSILSTDKKLISFGTDYSAGSGISIIDHTISIVPSAVGKVYSAGPNIDIYDNEGQPTISSKDWTQEIDQSSSGAVTESISYFNTWINGQYTEDISNVTNNLTALSDNLSSYYKKTETSSNAEISAALDYVSAHAVGDVEVNNYVHNNSATIDEVNSAYQSNSATYLTGVNIPESATWNETSNVVKESSASWNQGKTYTGISPIVVNNNESKISADTWTLTAGDGISFVENSASKITRIDCTATGDAGVNSFVTNNSASILDVNSSYKSKSGTFLTAIPSDVATTGDVANLEQTITETYYPKSNPSSFATESWVNSQGYITGVNISESANWNKASEVVSSNSASWSEGKTYTGISPVVVNNDENKISADTWTLTAGDGISFTDDSANKVTRIDVTAQGGSVSSKYGTITVDGSDIEATNKALYFKSNGFTSSFDYISLNEYNPTATLTWDNYSEGTTLTLYVMNNGDDSDTLTYSSNTNVTGLITAPKWTLTDVNLSLPNATAVQFSANHRYDIQNIHVTAASSFQVKELACKNDLPTYTYNSNNKLSAINGSALVGNEDYLVEQGFVQNLKSPNGTISVLNNKIEGTNSAVKSDTLIEGFVSAYNRMDVYPGNSATLTWDRYVPNATLTFSAELLINTTLTYSSNTNVTGNITLLFDDTASIAQGSLELPTDSTSIVIGDSNNYNRYNFTVSAKDCYEVGELAWASALPTYEYDNTNKISAINGSALTDVNLNNIVQTNSGSWGGSALPISAGNGINLSMVDGVLVISLA